MNLQKTIILFLSVILGLNFAVAQKPKKVSVKHNYTFFPKTIYAKETTGFKVEFSANDFVGKLVQKDYAEGNVIVVKDGGERKTITGIRVKGLTQSYTGENALIIKINAKAGKGAAQVAIDAKKALGNKDLVTKYKNAVKFKIDVYENDKLLKTYNYTQNSKPESDWVLKLKNPDAPGKPTYRFAGQGCLASFIIDDAFNTIGKKISRDLNKDFAIYNGIQELDFYTVKAKKFKYDDLNKSIKTGIKEFKSKDFANVESYVSSLKEAIAKTDFDNKKAQYNKKLAGKLYLNIINAYLVAGQFDKVEEVYVSMNDIIEEISKSDKSTAKKAYNFALSIRNNHKLNAHRL